MLVLLQSLEVLVGGGPGNVEHSVVPLGTLHALVASLDAQFSVSALLLVLLLLLPGRRNLLLVGVGVSGSLLPLKVLVSVLLLLGLLPRERRAFLSWCLVVTFVNLVFPFSLLSFVLQEFEVLLVDWRLSSRA